LGFIAFYKTNLENSSGFSVVFDTLENFSTKDNKPPSVLSLFPKKNSIKFVKKV
jgi:hypothetical protein